MPLFLRSPQSTRKKSDGVSVANGGDTDESSAVSPINNNVQHRKGKSRQPLVQPLNLPGANYQSNNGGGSSFLLGGQYYPGKDKRFKRNKHSSKSRLLRLLFLTCFLGTIALFMLYIHSFPIMTFRRKDILTTWSSTNTYALDRWYQHVWPQIMHESSPKSPQVAEFQEKIHQHLEQLAHGWWHRNDPPRTLKPRKLLSSKDKKTRVIKASPKVSATKSQTYDATDIGVFDRNATSHSPAWTVQTMDAITNKRPSCPIVSPSTTDKIRIQVSLVTQTTLDRFHLLQHTCRRWTDPIVVVLALDHTESLSFIPPAWWQPTCSHARLITMTKPTDPQDYPVNYYRNVGLQAVATSHVLILDVDLIPSRDLVTVLHSTLATQLYQPQHLPSALVVPAWEYKRSSCNATICNEQSASFLPSDMTTLAQCAAAKNCQVFQQDNNWEGHGATHSYKWLESRSEDSNGVLPIRCFDSLRYEPYVAIPWCVGQNMTHNIDSQTIDSSLENIAAPYYDERFVGYGKNKIEYVQHLRFMGYQFSILPPIGGFVVHYPHAESAIKQKWNDRSKYNLHQRMDALYPEFLQQVVQKHPPISERKIIGPCSASNKESVKK